MSSDNPMNQAVAGWNPGRLTRRRQDRDGRLPSLSIRSAEGDRRRPSLSLLDNRPSMAPVIIALPRECLSGDQPPVCLVCSKGVGWC